MREEGRKGGKEEGKGRQRVGNEGEGGRKEERDRE